MGETGGFLAVSALSNYGQVIASKDAQEIASEFRQQRFRHNQQIAELRAEDAVIRGDKAAEVLDEQTTRLIGSQRAAFAAQGIEVDSGSALEIQVDTRAMSEADKLTIRNNAWREAFGYRAQALSFKGAAEFDKAATEFAVRQTIATGGLNFARDVARSGVGGRFGTKDTSTGTDSGPLPRGRVHERDIR